MLDEATRTAGDESGQVVMRMLVAVGESGAVDDHRIVEHGPLAFLRRLIGVRSIGRRGVVRRLAGGEYQGGGEQQCGTTETHTGPRLIGCGKTLLPAGLLRQWRNGGFPLGTGLWGNIMVLVPSTPSGGCHVPEVIDGHPDAACAGLRQ